MKKMLILGLIALSLNCYSKIIGYQPDYIDGYLNVDHLNSGIQLASIQYDSTQIQLVIPKGVYKLRNDKSINLKNNVKLICDSVTFIYEWVNDNYKGDIFSFHWVKKAGIQGLIIDFSNAYKDKINYKSSEKFINRAIINLEGADSCSVERVSINKILGSGIELSNSKNCIISNCNIQNSWVHGANSGTQGYGVNLVGVLCQYNTIKNNFIKNTRHNIVIQYAANFNLIDSNKLYEAMALHKVLFLEVYMNTYNLTLHGNEPFKNIISNNICDRITIDNVKSIGNGVGNEIIGNDVNTLEVQSKAPYYEYNQGQKIKYNKYKVLKVEAKNCEIIGNINK